jgi:hypothetical protein
MEEKMANSSAVTALKEKLALAISRQDRESVAENLEMLQTLYSKATEPPEKEAVGNEIATALRGLADICEDDSDIFEALMRLNDCRDLLDDFPQSARYAGCLLYVMGALLYLKVQQREDGMVEEYTEEIVDIANRFPTDEEINMTACACLANLIPLCGSFDAPLSLAYSIADEMEPIAQRFGGSPQILEAYCHVLISVSAYADRSNNGAAYNKYEGRFRRIYEDKSGGLDSDSRHNVREHMMQNGM